MTCGQNLSEESVFRTFSHPESAPARPARVPDWLWLLGRPQTKHETIKAYWWLMTLRKPHMIKPDGEKLLLRSKRS